MVESAHYRGPGLQSQHHMVAHCSSSSRGFNHLFWPLPTPSTHVVHMPTCRQDAHTHTTNLKRKKRGRPPTVWGNCNIHCSVEIKKPLPWRRPPVWCEATARRLMQCWCYREQLPCAVGTVSAEEFWLYRLRTRRPKSSVTNETSRAEQEESPHVTIFLRENL